MFFSFILALTMLLSAVGWKSLSSISSRLAHGGMLSSRGFSARGLAMQSFRPSWEKRSSNDRPSFRNRKPADPFAKLTFKKTLKIDTSIQTPIDEIPFSEGTKSVLEEKGFKALTPVQSQSYEYVFGGGDVVARSRTGTGKTFAFGLPLIEKLVADGLHNQRSPSQPFVLILEPTRELALQVAQELSSVCRKHRMRVEAIYGGASFGLQEKALRGGVHFLIATPGRLLDHISRGTVDLSRVRHVVLDEGDTMLEMGFQQDVESILMNVKTPGAAAKKAARKSLDDLYADDSDDELSGEQREVQMLLFSATMPGWVCQLTDKLMKNPIFLDAVQEGETRLASTITHYAIKLPNLQDRRQAVKSLVEDLILTKGAGGQTIVFTNTKEEADDLMGAGCFGLLKSQVLHGDIGQNSRQATIRAFKEGKIDVLVATDVAARGLDIAGVDLVVHTAAPQDSDSYVHRSGRTGRAGRSGTAVLLYSADEERKLSTLQKTLNFVFVRATPPSPAQIVEASASYALKRLETVDEDIVKYFEPMAKELITKAGEGKLFHAQPIVIGEEEEEVVEEDESSKKKKKGASRARSVPAADSAAVPENLSNVVARCLAVISNRLSISSRSLLTGDSDTLTLRIDATYKDGSTPKTVPEWHKSVSGIVKVLLDMPTARIGQMTMARDDAAKGVFLLADFKEADAREILRRITDLPQETTRGLRISVCETLPELIRDPSSNERSSSSSWSRGARDDDRRGPRRDDDRRGPRRDDDHRGARRDDDRYGRRRESFGRDRDSYGRDRDARDRSPYRSEYRR